MKSPRITNLSWGRIEVEDFPPLKDAKLFPGGCREWDWNESGTGHSQGVQPGDIEELISHGAKVIVIGKGVYGKLSVAKSTLKILQEKGIELHVLKTKEAVKKYNELCANNPVGALIHSTC